MTIRTVDQKNQEKIGKREGLSFYDVMTANRMYKCDELCRNKPKCPQNSYLGKDCNCYCKGNPVRRCTNTDRTKPKTRRLKKECKNSNNNCHVWATANNCDSSPFVQSACRKSCKLCSAVKRVKKNVCRDRKSKRSCKFWKGKGYCSGVYKSIMTLHCKQTCNLCKSADQPSCSKRSSPMMWILIVAIVIHFIHGKLC